MKTASAADVARLAVMLGNLRLLTIKAVWPSFAEKADTKGWPAARFLSALAEHELVERDRRRIRRHLAEARLRPGKTLDTFDIEAVPSVSKAQVMAIAAGDAWLGTGANLLLFGPPASGKSHLAAAIGLALIQRRGVLRRDPGRAVAVIRQGGVIDDQARIRPTDQAIGHAEKRLLQRRLVRNSGRDEVV